MKDVEPITKRLKVGQKIISRRIFASDFEGTDKMQAFVISRIAYGGVYVKADYGIHDDGTRWLGSTSWVSDFDFERFFDL